MSHFEVEFAKKGYFPSSVQQKGCRRVMWRSSEIQDWMNDLHYTKQNES
ncbi:AlpA family phage regulatory protein [Aeromonas rivipollensis]